MKAVVCNRYGPPEVLQIKEVKKPMPADDEVLISVRATTVTMADFRIRSFTVPRSFWIPARLALGITKPRRPIPGVELAGEIESIGRKVTRFKKGDKVFAATLASLGAYAEYKCISENSMIVLMPENISYEEAAAIPVGACTALHYLRKANIHNKQKILIYGASGSVGTYAVQLAKYFGAEVTGVCSRENIDLVKSLGADQVLDYTAPDFLSKLEIYHVVFIAVPKLPFNVCNRILTQSGVYLNIAEPFKSLAMMWASMTTKKKIYVGESPPKTSDSLTFLTDLVQKGALKVVIDKRYKLEEIVEAHRYVDKGHKKGNVVVSV
jgi:NADPH:quinone reductase-like Zn-dependent oxidoreductase